MVTVVLVVFVVLIWHSRSARGVCPGYQWTPTAKAARRKAKADRWLVDERLVEARLYRNVP